MKTQKEFFGCKNQTEFIVFGLKNLFLNRELPPCNRHKGRPADGWLVIDDTELIQAIKEAGLPTEKLGVGSNPAPSTQSPSVVVYCAQRLKAIWQLHKRGEHNKLSYRLLIAMARGFCML
ncbi:MAG: hypothetical protein JRJ62_16995 [Deltaproteobacteria bacterium]|nr:hypothetical protein [Deltaproteobacteria bacterium]